MIKILGLALSVLVSTVSIAGEVKMVSSVEVISEIKGAVEAANSPLDYGVGKLSNGKNCYIATATSKSTGAFNATIYNTVVLAQISIPAAIVMKSVTAVSKDNFFTTTTYSFNSELGAGSTISITNSDDSASFSVGIREAGKAIVRCSYELEAGPY